MTSSVSNIKSWDSICKRLDVVHVTDIENNTSCNTTEMLSPCGWDLIVVFFVDRCMCDWII